MVYCKPPFGSAEHVLEYLGRYSHRVSISNHRIINLENGYVTFKWKDYRDYNKEKFMTLTVDEFMRRFFMHVLPRKFVKIRHYGILSNRNRYKYLSLL
ncbi:transposase [Clostridium estertheticum]|uniref:IS91 family transposase n=1 Tax=Clostridium estertheticum TaxID=238834 RepID=UPI001CF0F6DA|nr:transposase [Clostridium estertheticum]MCB2307411.1 transposase [Clostridium estertheticum]MCB2345061.1 transposase [Clostridium estertheticum]MCB2349779.1 transposase [Clostridium estertheticum]WAG48271.1 transposase [Clostridium estertheticum]